MTMRRPTLLFAAALLCLTPLAALAQASAPPAADAAPAPVSPAKTGPRLLTPTEKRDSATPAGELRPERPVTPQISIPLGRKPAPPSPTAPLRHGTPVPGTPGVDEAAVRCETLVGEQVRAKCRDKAAHDARTRAPG